MPAYDLYTDIHGYESQSRGYLLCSISVYDKTKRTNKSCAPNNNNTCLEMDTLLPQRYQCFAISMTFNMALFHSFVYSYLILYHETQLTPSTMWQIKTQSFSITLFITSEWQQLYMCCENWHFHFHFQYAYVYVLSITNLQETKSNSASPKPATSSPHGSRKDFLSF